MRLERHSRGMRHPAERDTGHRIALTGELDVGSPSYSADVVLFVVHTWPEVDKTGEEVGRIISARKATGHERRAYEEGTL